MESLHLFQALASRYQFTIQSITRLNRRNFRNSARQKRNFRVGKSGEEMPSPMVTSWVPQMSESLKQCPHCAELVQPDAILCRFCDRGISKDSFKNCPHCTEMIWTEATFCRYCRSAVREEWVPSATDRNSLFAQIKAGTGIHLDDEAIDKLFERIMRRSK